MRAPGAYFTARIGSRFFSGACAALTIFVVSACGSSSTSNASPVGVTGCTLTAGTYIGSYETSNVEGGTGSQQCPVMKDGDVQVSGGGEVDAGSGCNTAFDSSQCQYTSDCSQSTGGNVTTTHTVAVVANDAESGTMTLTEIDSSGKLLLDCSYTFTFTLR